MGIFNITDMLKTMSEKDKAAFKKKCLVKQKELQKALKQTERALKALGHKPTKKTKPETTEQNVVRFKVHERG